MWVSRRTGLYPSRVVIELTVSVVKSHCRLSLRGQFRSFGYANGPRLLAVVVLNPFVLLDMGVYRH